MAPYGRSATALPNLLAGLHVPSLEGCQESRHEFYDAGQEPQQADTFILARSRKTMDRHTRKRGGCAGAGGEPVKEEKAALQASAFGRITPALKGPRRKTLGTELAQPMSLFPGPVSAPFRE